MEQTEQAKSEDSLQTSSWNEYLIEVLWLLLASETKPLLTRCNWIQGPNESGSHSLRVFQW